MKSKHRTARIGLTLLEVLVVIAIIAVILAIILPAIQSTRESAARLKCQNNLKQMALAVHNAHHTLGFLPQHGYAMHSAGWVRTDAYDSTSAFTTGSQWLKNASVHVFILPFVEEGNDIIANWDNRWDVMGTGGPGYDVPPPKLYLCPKDPTIPRNGVVFVNATPPTTHRAVSSYPINVQLFGANWSVDTNKRAQFPRSIPDGASKTLMFMEFYGLCSSMPYPPTGGFPIRRVANWMQTPLVSSAALYWETWPGLKEEYPVGSGNFIFRKFQPTPTFGTNTPGVDCNPEQTQSIHLAGMQAAMADGSVVTIRQDVDPTVWHALITPAGNESVSDDFTR